MRKLFVSCVVAASCLGGVATAQTSVVLEDFSGVVNSKKQPGGGGDFVTWFDSLTKSSTDPSASLDPAAALKVSVDGVINGTYRIFQAVVPSSGQWHVNCKIRVVENSPFDSIQNYQLGVIVNGVHRATGNTKIAPASIFVSMPAGYLTSGDDSSKGFQNLRTPDFAAGQADNILISLGTDVTSGNFNLNSGNAGGYVIVDDIVLEAAGLPVSVSSWTLE